MWYIVQLFLVTAAIISLECIVTQSAFPFVNFLFCLYHYNVWLVEIANDLFKKYLVKYNNATLY